MTDQTMSLVCRTEEHTLCAWNEPAPGKLWCSCPCHDEASQDVAP